MREESVEPRDRAAARVAARQHGVIATDQLNAAGIDKSAIARRVRAGRLHPIHRGAYAVGHTALSRKGRFKAATLACGEGAALSHQSAADLWGCWSPAMGRFTSPCPSRAGAAAQRNPDSSPPITDSGRDHDP